MQIKRDDKGLAAEIESRQPALTLGPEASALLVEGYSFDGRGVDGETSLAVGGGELEEDQKAACCTCTLKPPSY